MPQPEYDRSRVGSYLGLGAGFAGSTLIFAALGWYVDRHIGATPVFTLLGTFLGAAAGFYNLYRHAMALQDNSSKNREDGGESKPSGKGPEGQ
ncbi:MAG: AtpZ/AtpI family protein [Gemmatimonadota bacterium]|nr:MAG: AtpZ/AtpI family protein [Gemmatimonadota bacterium]